MKTLLRARQLAPKKNDSIRTSLARGFGTPEGAIGQEQRRHGRTVQPSQWPAVASVSVHRPEQQSRHGHAYAVLRDGPSRAGSGNAGADLEPDARGRRDDRTGQRVIAAGLAAQAVDSAAQLESESGLNSANSQSLPTSAAADLPESLTLFVRETLRAAALAPTIFDALDITGDALRRIADIAHVEVSA